MSAIFVCELTSGLDNLSRREQRDAGIVLNVLEARGRFSVFEATANQVIARTITELQEAGLIRVTPEGFPWSRVELMPEAKAVQDLSLRRRLPIGSRA